MFLIPSVGLRERNKRERIHLWYLKHAYSFTSKEKRWNWEVWMSEKSWVFHPRVRKSHSASFSSSIRVFMKGRVDVPLINRPLRFHSSAEVLPGFQPGGCFTAAEQKKWAAAHRQGEDTSHCLWCGRVRTNQPLQTLYTPFIYFIIIFRFFFYFSVRRKLKFAPTHIFVCLISWLNKMYSDIMMCYPFFLFTLTWLFSWKDTFYFYLS